MKNPFALNPLRCGLGACMAVMGVTSGCQASPANPPLIASPRTEAIMPLPHKAVKEDAGAQKAHEFRSVENRGSLRPDALSPKERVPLIVRRGRLIVGVDQAHNLLSFRDPTTGTLEGFEVDIAREIARDIFGDPNRIEFRYINATNWEDALHTEAVDIAMRTISITQERENEVEFSIPYFAGYTRMLVDKSSGISSLEDLAGGTACVTENSTGAAFVRLEAPQTHLLITQTSADCLVALQQDQVAAIITDDTILSGMAAQDPFTAIVGDNLNRQDYAVAIGQSDYRRNTSGLVRQVNVTLERIRADGTWQRSYNKWLGAYLPQIALPAPRYREEE
ncbi:glutamate ABC transporter substrate-binding protein [Corynebacterium sp. ES2775-CONJ]|uniref:glutamate ABC transporter substrate-binding protein n=1 Tax=Corynebacterium sp. ES2775-CONJ TaxID=2974029 RepID=UPI002168FAF7|nr:glutamate ABC transporter substrate-binding protein [Corynebacterium sp. ES2775-CONJ]MCS4490214.1 glutamate ABC transporter substrate-binding protein [Corynebacterium sp. ES2775-CONJ]